MQPITILLVDDHQLIRDAWILFLTHDPRFAVAGSTGSAEEALAIARDKRPDVSLIDISMSPMDGFALTRQIRLVTPLTKILGVSMYALPAYAKKMMQAGAMGYVTKNSTREELLHAIVEIHAGRKYICDEIKTILAHEQFDENSGQPAITDLSKRELQIVELIRQGHSSKEIAVQLTLSLKTVEVHRYNILKKLRLRNTAALVNYLNTQGL